MTLVVCNNKLITKNSPVILNKLQLWGEIILLQKRIYIASVNYDYKRVHKLQLLLLRSQSTHLFILLNLTNNLNLKNQYRKQNLYSIWYYKNSHRFSKILTAFDKKQSLGTITIKLYNLVSQNVVRNLYWRIIDCLIYLCLKPEWENKLSKAILFYDIKRTYTNSLGIIQGILSYYCPGSTTENCKIYVLKNKLHILHNISSVKDQYLISKLNPTHSIKRLLKQYLTFDNLSINRSKNAHVLYLLKNIITDNLKSEIYLQSNLLVNVKHKNIIKLSSDSPRFLSHDGYFVFFSDNKSEIISIQNHIIKFLNNILTFDTSNVTVLELQRGFNFLNFYIKCLNAKHDKFCSYLVVQPSIKSQVILIKKVKSILYHYDSLHRVRPNTYLSFHSAVRKIKFLTRQWKKYYAVYSINNKKVYSKLNSVIQVILRKWYAKNTKTLCQIRLANNLFII